jgi:hypothetical protein
MPLNILQCTGQFLLPAKNFLANASSAEARSPGLVAF